MEKLTELHHGVPVIKGKRFDLAAKKLYELEVLEEQGRLIEVITCKNCKYYKKDTSNINNPCGYCEIIPAVRYENEYCSLAEAKLAELKGTEEW